MLGKIEGPKEKGMTEDEMVRWEIVNDREAWNASAYGISRIGHNLVTEQQQITKHDMIWPK